MTHFTFDLQVELPASNVWTTGSVTAELTDPDYSFFQHPFGGNTAPNSSIFFAFPALAFDSFYCDPSEIVDDDTVILPGSNQETPTLVAADWAFVPPVGNQPGTIARFTIVSSALDPQVVPQGTGGPEATIVGTITGDSTFAGNNTAKTAFAFDIVTYAPPCPGDTTGDLQVNTDDFLAVLNNWGNCPAPCPPTCPGDSDGNCTVNVDDFLAVLSNWGSCLGP